MSKLTGIFWYKATNFWNPPTPTSSYFPVCPNVVMHSCHANCASDKIDTDPCTLSCNYCFFPARTLTQNLSIVIYIVMHTVMELVLPMCSALFHDSVYWHSHHHSYWHAISASTFRQWSKKRFFILHFILHVIMCLVMHWSIPLSLDIHIVMHTVIQLVLQLCSNTDPKTVSRHSHCHTHRHVVSIFRILDMDPYNFVHWPFTLSYSLSCG
jgi:hypothetical protein